MEIFVSVSSWFHRDETLLTVNETKNRTLEGLCVTNILCETCGRLENSQRACLTQVVGQGFPGAQPPRGKWDWTRHGETPLWGIRVMPEGPCCPGNTPGVSWSGDDLTCQPAGWLASLEFATVGP